MSWEAGYTLAIVILMFVALAKSWAPSDTILWLCLTAIVAAGQLTGSKLLPSASEAISGFGNSGLITIGLLFVVVEGLTRTGATSWLSEPIVKLSRNRFGIKPVLLVVVAATSAFLNNTAIVAMFMPITQDLCKRLRIPPSKLFMPMCYAATIGGVCTLMGTSTNLVIDGLMRKNGLEGMGVFDIAWVGVPITVAGIIYLLIGSKYLLPDRRPPVSMDDDPREYSVEMLVVDSGPLVGKSIEAAGLRQLPGLFLAEIVRGDEVLAAVSPHERLQGNDQLIFVGVTDSVVDLRRVVGLSPAHASTNEAKPGRRGVLSEVVVSASCPLVGKKIRESDFRSTYDAVVVAVARDGKRVSGKIGEVSLLPGDCLLLETQADFAAKHRLNRHFFLVSSLPDSEKLRSDKSIYAISILAVLIVCVAFSLVDLLFGAMVAASAMLYFRCCSADQARQSIEWNVLLVIAAAFGIAEALESTGAAADVANAMLSLAGTNHWTLLATIYFVTMVATELVTNNAAAAMMFPIALHAAQTQGIDPMPLILAVMIAASSGFATPFGYQTNMMVQGPGGYHFKDYVRYGLPLDFIIMIVSVVLIPLIWPFAPSNG